MPKLLRRGKAFYLSLFALAGPLILQNLISSSAGLVDTFMVGALGQDELAALALANTPFFIGMLLVFGLQSGGSVLISQYWGKRDKDAINRIAGISWIAAGGFSLIFATVMFLFPRQIIGLTTNNSALLEIAVRYGKIVAYSYFISSFVTIYLGVRRSCESPQFGTSVVMVGVVSNVFFNYVLIFGKLGFPEMGVEGAAWGTVISRVIEFAITVAYIALGDRKKKIIPIKPRLLVRPGKLLTRDFIKYSTPVMLNEVLWATGFSLYTVIYGHMAASSDIVAAYALTGNIERIVTVATFALANAAAVFVGKEIGAGGSREEVYSLGKTFAALAALVGLVSGILLIGAMFGIVRPFVFPSFGLTDGAMRVCLTMSVTLGVVMFARSLNATLVIGILRGGGDVNFGLVLDIGSMYFWSLPTAAIAALVFKVDIMWVYLLVVSEEPIKATIGFLRFRSKKWIMNVTRDVTV